MKKLVINYKRILETLFRKNSSFCMEHPLGVKPEKFTNEEKIIEILHAIERYIKCGDNGVILNIWCDELSHLIKRRSEVQKNEKQNN